MKRPGYTTQDVLAGIARLEEGDRDQGRRQSPMVHRSGVAGSRALPTWITPGEMPIPFLAYASGWYGHTNRIVSELILFRLLVPQTCS